MGSALVYLTFGAIISRQSKGWIAKIYFLSVALLLAMLVGISRVYLGVHYPSDVLAGWAAGSLWSIGCPGQRQVGVLVPRSGFHRLAHRLPSLGQT